MFYVVKQIVKKFRKKKNVVIVDRGFESIEIMEWGRKSENEIAMVMTYESINKCHPEYFRSKTSAINNHMKEKETRGPMFVTHWDHGTFTTVKDSSILRLVDNDFSWKRMNSRLVSQFNKGKKKSRWLGLRKVSFC